MSGRSYHSRLKMLNLDSLELRRLRADLLFGVLHTNTETLFTLRAHAQLRGHRYYAREATVYQFHQIHVFVIALSISGTVYLLILLIFLASWSLKDLLVMNTWLSFANWILHEQPYYLSVFYYYCFYLRIIICNYTVFRKNTHLCFWP